jgi:cold shock CspA family protein
MVELRRPVYNIKTKIHSIVSVFTPHPHIILYLYSMSSSDIEYEVDPVVEPRLTGVVKWFNNKSGFGFITVCQETHPLHTKDIFCYYKSLRVVNLQFRYLVQGEYVDFTLVKAAVEPHEYQAVDVTGVQGGPLMCETRNMHTDTYNMTKGPGLGQYSQQQYTNRPPRSSNTHVLNSSVAATPKKRQVHNNKPSADEDGFTRVNRNHRKKTIVVV